jgi:hypothetical protein
MSRSSLVRARVCLVCEAEALVEVSLAFDKSFETLQHDTFCLFTRIHDFFQIINTT